MRKYYLDNIRWMTVILVVVYHVIYMYNAEGILGGVGQITNLQVQYYDLYQYVVYPWFMPILFIVSGICSRLYLKRHTDKEFVRSRTRKLLVPSTIGLFVFQFIQGYISMAISDAFDTMTAVPALIKYLIMAVSGIGVLWYIQILWVFSMLLVLVRKIEKGRLDAVCEKAGLPALLLMTFLLWGAAQILNTPVIVVYRFGFYGLLFLLGYFVFSHDRVVDVLKKNFVPLLIAACALCVAFCVRWERFPDKRCYVAQLSLHGSFRQPAHALSLDPLRNLGLHAVRRGCRARRIRKGMNPGKSGGTAQFPGCRKVRFAFAGETGNDVAGKERTGLCPAQQFHGVQYICSTIGPPHQGQNAVAAGLHAQVKRGLHTR